MAKSYDQYCPVARALDVIGDRWTLLVIRDLFLGPRRYTDLANGLPGISPNILADRLRELEDAGVVTKRKLAAPAAGVVYELTDRGRELEPVMVRLAEWGRPLLDGAPAPEDMDSPDRFVMGLKLGYRADAAGPGFETYELRIDDGVYTVTPGADSVTIERGPARDPDAVLSMDLKTFTRLGLSGASVRDAARRGRLRIERGGKAALSRFAKVFSLTA